MIFWKYLFFIAIATLFFNYIGYALLIYPFVYLKRKNRNPKVYKDTDLPSVSFIVAAYNEENCIRQKLENALEQEYPASQIEFIFITDGSTDRTPEIIKQFSRVTLLHQSTRAGKTEALNRAVAVATGDVLIFSDANTLLNKTMSVHHEKTLG